ncbi:MAG: ATP-binding protein [Kineosporiaceae bacterium]
MTRALFEQVDRIKRILPTLHLPGLVAIFTSLTTDELVLVYVEPHDAQQQTATPYRTITLADLHTLDRTAYDGPLLALAAIDLVDQDIPTKGPQFCRLDRILRRAGYVIPLRYTMAALARHLDRPRPRTDAHDPAPGPPARARHEIAALRAPEALAALSPARRRGVIAYLPERDQLLRLTEEGLDAVPRPLLAGGETVIAFREVRPLLQGVQPAPARGHHPIELRTVLRRSGLDDALLQTQSDLAAAFHRRWTRSRTWTDLRTAYSLALETHLAGGDVDDLVAVLPTSDFASFLAEGTGTYVYRRLLSGDADRAPRGIRRVHLDDPGAEPDATTGSVVFSLLPLRARLSTTMAATNGHAEWADLGPVLRVAGRTEILARNAWLLVEDFLESPRERRADFRISAEDLLQTMAHCCDIFSLTDPWRTRQGRRDEWLLEAYRTLRRVLTTLIERTEGARRAHYLALDLWYGCALNDDAGIRASLDTMVRVLERAGAEPGRVGSPMAQQMAHLEQLGRFVLEMLRGGAHGPAAERLLEHSALSTPQLLSRAADMDQPIELATGTFLDSLRHVVAVVDLVRVIEASQIPVRIKTERLGRQILELRAARRQIFAPEHQARVLATVIDAAIGESDHLIRALRARVFLHLELQTHSITADTQHSGIVFLVKNVGNAPARELEIELAPSVAFVLRDGAFKQTLPALAAGEEKEFRFRVRVITEDGSFPVHCRVSNLDDAGLPQSWNTERSIQVTWMDPAVFVIKPNPYFYGPKVHQYQHFFGRREELEEILAHLAGRRPQHVLLRGARRTGKSSLLNVLKAVISTSGVRGDARAWFGVPPSWHAALDATIPVDLDLQGSELAGPTPTPTGFYRAVLAALDAAGSTNALIGDLQAEPTITAGQFVRVLRSVCAEWEGRRVVFLVDEFDMVDRLDDPSLFYSPLRHVISSVPDVTWIVATALGLSHQVRDYESPLFNIFKIIDLGPLGVEAASRLILAPWQPEEGDTGEGPSARLQFADDAVLAIVHESGQHPYFVQMLCSYIVYYANRLRTSFIQHRTVMQVVEGMVVTEPKAKQHLDYLWDSAGPLGKLILLELLRDPEPMRADALRHAVFRTLAEHGLSGAPAASPDAYEAGLRQLIDVSAVRELPQVAYQFAVPLLRRLVLRRSEHEDLDLSVSEALRHLERSANSDD